MNVYAENELIYNYIRYVFNKIYGISLKAYRYTETSASFYIQDVFFNRDLTSFKEQLTRELSNIEKVEDLFPLNDINSIYFEEQPKVVSKIFKYNSFYDKPFLEYTINKNTLLKMLERLKIERKRSSLKVTFRSLSSVR